MAENFQGVVCGGNWWPDSSRFLGSSPCSLMINRVMTGNFVGQSHDHINMGTILKTATNHSSDDSTGSATGGSGGGLVVLQDVQKPQQYSIDSSLEMMELWLSSPTTTDEIWIDQDFLSAHDSGKSEEKKYTQTLLQETAALNSSTNYRHQTRIDCQEENKEDSWSCKNLKQVNEQSYLNSINTGQEILASFPLNLASDIYTSSLLQTLFDTDSGPEKSLSDNQMMINHSYATNTYNMMDSNELSPPFLNPCHPRNNPADHLKYNKNTQFLDAKTASVNNIRKSFDLPSMKSQITNLPNLSAEHHEEESQNLAALTRIKTRNNESPFKRRRIETPSPLPSFKVRKEKMGDRITALQQLVSPFGKTDTASVLHEAIEYIKYLHDQLSTVLSNRYLKNGSSPAQFQEEPKRDLKTQGLCLVPLSSTFQVVSETMSDFWTPSFEGNFR